MAATDNAYKRPVTDCKRWVVDNRHEIERFFKSKDFSDILKSGMPKVFSVLGQTASVIISIVASCITLLYMFFILLDYEYLTTNWIKIFPKRTVRSGRNS